jgi:hypothetical protein
MGARPFRPSSTALRSSQPAPSTLAAASALLATVALAAIAGGCGKALPRSAGAGGGAPGIAPVGPHGAGGVVTKNTTRLGGADVATDAAAVAQTVYPGAAPSGRPAAVVLVDEHDWPLALAASALAGAPLRAPLLYADGDALPAASAQALSTMRPTGAAALAGAQVLELGTSAAPAGYRASTLAGTTAGSAGGTGTGPTGATGAGSAGGAGTGGSGSSAASPYAQAGAIARLLTAVHRGVHDAIVVAADGPPAIAMPAAALAAQTGAPILFVSARGVPAATAAALTRMHRPAIYVVGSAAVVPGAVLGQLGRLGSVKRIVSPVGHIAAEDAAGNAVAVALYSDGAFGWGADKPPHGLAFANAGRPLDAPAAAPLAASGDYAPLLLLEGPDAIPAVLDEYLTDIRPGYSEAPAYRAAEGVYNHGWLIGDERAISTATQAEIDGKLEIALTSSGAGGASAPEPETEPPATRP